MKQLSTDYLQQRITALDVRVNDLEKLEHAPTNGLSDKNIDPVVQELRQLVEQYEEYIGAVDQQRLGQQTFDQTKSV